MLVTSHTLLHLLAGFGLARSSPHNLDGHYLAPRDVAARTVTVTSISTMTEFTTLTTCPVSTNSSTKSSPSQTTTSGGFSASPSSTASGNVIKQGCFWVVPDVGTFRNKAAYSFNGNSLPQGLIASNYDVSDTDNGAPYDHKFSPKNVRVSNGFLTLTVPGGQKSASSISCAEVVTAEEDILYASVRVQAQFSKVPGTCQSKFKVR